MDRGVLPLEMTAPPGDGYPTFLSVLRLCARDQRCEDFLAAGAGIVPEGQGELVAHRQPLIIADELQAAAIHRRIYRRVPALRSHAHIWQETRPAIHRLRQVDIDQMVVAIAARI